MNKKLSSIELEVVKTFRHIVGDVLRRMVIIYQDGEVTTGFAEATNSGLKLIQARTKDIQQILGLVESPATHDTDRPTDKNFRYTLIINGRVIYYRSANYDEVHEEFVEFTNQQKREGWALFLDEYEQKIIAYCGKEMLGLLES